MVEAERDALDPAAPADRLEAGGLHHGAIPAVPHRPARAIGAPHLPPHHGADQRVGIEPGRRPRPHRGPVAQHGDAVGERQHLVEMVADIDDADTLAAQGPNGGEEDAFSSGVSAEVGSSRISTSRRAVAAAGGEELVQRLGHLDELALAGREPPDRHVRRQVGAEHCHRGRRTARWPAPDRSGRIGPGRGPPQIFSATPRPSTRLSSWNTVAMPAALASCGRWNARATPSTTSSPSSGRVTPARTFIRVDLPAPFSPTRACTSPAARSKKRRRGHGSRRRISGYPGAKRPCASHPSQGWRLTGIWYLQYQMEVKATA